MKPKQPFGDARNQYYDWKVGPNENGEYETATEQAERIKREFEEKEWKRRRWEGLRQGEVE